LSELAEALKISDGFDLVREAVRLAFQELIEAELTERIGAGHYERSEQRANERNRHRPRVISTKAGDVSLGIPKLRKGSFFQSIPESHVCLEVLGEHSCDLAAERRSSACGRSSGRR
jgi:transposase-like protein